MTAGQLLAELASSATSARERVALLLGPGDQALDADRDAYYRELSEWVDWDRWVDPERVDTTPDWLKA